VSKRASRHVAAGKCGVLARQGADRRDIVVVPAVCAAKSQRGAKPCGAARAAHRSSHGKGIARGG
jgi:hypothetical protein